MTRLLALVAATALTGAAAWALFGALAPRAAPAEGGPVVLVSGRDDHGLVQHDELPLYDAPAGTQPVGRVHDGRVARVLEARGDWFRVKALGQPAAEGWVNDFWLRGHAVRTDAGVQVRLVDAAADGAAVRVAVRPVTDPTATPAWVDAGLLREVGARGGHAP